MASSFIKSIRERTPLAGASKVPDHLYHTDWSRSLANAQLSSTGNFSEGILAGLALPGEVTAMAFDPVQGFLAVGTTLGTVHLFGSPPVQVSFTLRPSHKVNHLAFKSDKALLICIDEKDNISIFDLSRPDPQIRAAHASSTNQYRTTTASTGHSITGPPHPDTPQRVGVHTVRNKVLCIEVSSAHSHMFLGLRDGTVDTYDLERMCPSPYRVPNLWWEEEEILRNSGVPDAPNRRHVPLIIDIKTNPKVLNQLLLAYEGGAILLDIRERAVLKTFQLRLLPGTLGSGGNPDLVWTERAPPATCIAWRPDGEVFVMGHEDGCISFWHIRDDDKPIMVRTLDSLDVEKPVSDPTLLDTHQPSKEPIFKLAWSGFPEKGWMDMASATAASWQSQPRQTNANEPVNEPVKGTVLTVLGGAKAGIDAPGLFCANLPPYSNSLSVLGGGAVEANHKLRTALHNSLVPSSEAIYPTSSIVEDFMLLPRSNPHYSGTYDPSAVVLLLAADPALPTLPPPAAARGLACFAFPPRSKSSASLQYPTSPVHLRGPSLDSAPDLVSAPPSAQKELHLPLPLTLSGGGAVLGAKLEMLTPHAYRKLVGLLDVTGQNQKQEQAAGASTLRSTFDGNKPPLKLKGGKASASLSNEGSDGISDVLRSSKFRVLVTWHLDGTVRFYDASPHLLLMGDVDEEDVRQQSPLPRIWLQSSFPSPLPHLTFDIRSLLQSPSMMGHPSFDRARGRAKVLDVSFAAEVLETAVVLSTGQVLHYRFGFAQFSETEAIQEQVDESMMKLEAQRPDLAIPPVRSPSSATRSSHSHDSRRPGSTAASSRLSTDMAQILRDLSIDDPPSAQQPTMSAPPSNGVPPPRPRRDPNRVCIRGMPASGTGPDPARAEQPMLASPALNSTFSPRQPNSSVPSAAGEHDEIVFLAHLADPRYDGFKPSLMVDPLRGEVSACASSDIGFMAVACGTALAVMDFRSTELILKEGFGGETESAHGKRDEDKSIRKILEAESKSPIVHLAFSVCRVSDDPSLAPRLIVVRADGLITAWTLQKTLDMWLVERTSSHKCEELSNVRAIRILDNNGQARQALPHDLQQALREQEYGSIGSTPGSAMPSADVLLGFTDRQVTLRYGVTGPVVARADIGERVLGCGVIERAGDKVAAVVTPTSIRIFSLPRLESIIRLQRHHREVGESSGGRPSVSFGPQGDFVEVCSSLDVRMWTMFASLRRPGLPNLTLYDPVSSQAMPGHPSAAMSAAGVATSIAGWFGTKTTGVLSVSAHMDAVLAGPNRPDAPKLGDPLPPRDYRPMAAVRVPRGEANARGTPEETRAALPPLASAQREASKAKQVAATTDSAWQTGYQNIDLLKARGAMMSGIEDGLTSLERGASNFLKNTREAAVKGAAKDKMNKMFF
ncbi:Lethal giant larvae (Lgl)-like, C-terminal domain protein [Kalmanozyma brasiliensis GHG001]|uniref:Lethal giant larvae (Lgl)-like, C-terminal domain protein n=1 Tax=Kalmanozyma brasiliensis (strain GHG001) TaxID=1365824 RepID=UPI002867ED2F|nr:Lethal giant larvae (Lgl)-like, C-terminal domain protein [Kalmanozyma brasiliensis GHG001]EST04994.2 Lethal giant larvae (Lgl)-like, C-terminal domain protein [Kalmanozyma brasiliensis GHG001]